MNAPRTLLFSTVALFAASTASAASYEHIDRLALRLAGQLNELPGEFAEHYRHTPEYRHLVSDALGAAELAEHIHELAHHRGSLTHLANDLSKLDREFHHLEGLLAQITRQARYGHGHVHGDTRHVFHLMHEAEDNLHHLRDDIEEMTRSYRCNYNRQPAPVYYNRQGYNHGYQSSGLRVSPNGISVGNGRVSFRLGF